LFNYIVDFFLYFRGYMTIKKVKPTVNEF